MTRQPRISNDSRLHVIRISSQSATADSRGNAGPFGDTTLHAYVYPMQEIHLPVGEYSKFTIEAKSVEKGVKGSASFGIVNDAATPVRVRVFNADGARQSDGSIAVGQMASQSLMDGQRLEISIR